jgi:hypothetical protein
MCRNLGTKVRTIIAITISATFDCIFSSTITDVCCTVGIRAGKCSTITWNWSGDWSINRSISRLASTLVASARDGGSDRYGLDRHRTHDR